MTPDGRFTDVREVWMSTMVERVARAIEATYEQFSDPTPAQRARAAIEAMRDAALNQLLVAKYNIAPGCLADLFNDALAPSSEVSAGLDAAITEELSDRPRDIMKEEKKR
jgi:hypothetical protein